LFAWPSSSIMASTRSAVHGKKLLIRLAAELGKPRQCFAPEDSSRGFA
jgi:hypothetical protein